MKKNILCAWSCVLFLILLGCPYIFAQQNEQNNSGYTLGPGDVIEISVWKDETLTNKIVIRPDGKFSYPLIGEVLAKGRTVEAVRQEIEDKVTLYVPDTPVTIIVREINYPQIYIVGKVNKPGVFTMTGEPLTVLQALALAGGMAQFADKSDIIIIRDSGSQEYAVREVFRFDYNKISQGRNLKQNIKLRPGDTVVVP